MNTKLQIILFVIAGIFFLSSSFLVNIEFNRKNVAKDVSKEYISKTAEEKSAAGKSVSLTSKEVHSPTIPSDEHASKDLESYDDGIFHFFHFNRIKRFRKCVQNLCLFAKLFLIYTHSAVLIMEYMHILHH